MNGMIISSGSTEEGDYRYQVLELDVKEDEDPYRVRFLHVSAFKVPSRIVEMVERKNMQRRLDIPLLFGDMISWSETNVTNDTTRAITKFKREKNLYQTRASGHGCEVLLRGAIDPDDRLHIYTNMFRKLRLSADDMHIGIPNVYYNCWVEIKPGYDDFVASFSAFESICDLTVQEDLIMVPWNMSNSTYITRITMDSDSEDEHPWFVNTTCKGPPPELRQRSAFVSGPRTIFCAEHPNKMFIIPILKRNDLATKIGTELKIDAIYNRFENVYLVSKVYTPSSVISRLTDSSGRLKCSVHLTHIPGIFYNKELGFIDDPDGKLALLHITRYASSGFQVSVTDYGPSESANGKFRFRIADLIATAQECRIQKWLKNSIDENRPIILANESGTVVSNTQVFCQKHATLLFRHPVDVEPIPGKLVKFTAEYDTNLDEFVITEIEYLPNIGLNCIVRRMFKHSPYEEQFIFQVKARLSERTDVPPLLWCDHFGFADDLGLIKGIKKQKQYTVWVMLSRADFKDAYRPARVTWEVVSASSQEPTDRVTAQSGCRVLDKLHGELIESGSESCFSQYSDPITVYSEAEPPSVYQADSLTDASTLREELYNRDLTITDTSRLAHGGYGDDDVLSVQAGGLPAAERRSSNWDGGASASYSVGDYSDSTVPVSEKRNITMQMIVDQVNRNPHDPACTDQCVHDCVFLRELANHVVRTPNFWADCRKEYPVLAQTILDRIQRHLV